jgi:transcriptional regulator NrdR family protein
VLRKLQGLSEVAYVRFASVYRQFQGIRDFVSALDDLQSMGQREKNETEKSVFISPAIAYLEEH